MLNNVKRTVASILVAVILTGIFASVGGCTFALDGFGDFADYVVHVFNGCDSCNYVRMLEYGN